MMLKFTQEFFLQVVPEWYVPEVLSGEGTLEEQICEYERQRAEKDGMYFASLKQGATIVEIIDAEEDETNSISEQGASLPDSGNSQESGRSA